MKNRYLLIFSILILVGISSCFKPEVYPPEPHIEFTSFTYKDTLDGLENPGLIGTLEFFFVDGDGDVGFDTTSPQKNTIFMEKYAMHNGAEVLLDFDVPLQYFVPIFKISEPDLALKGDMIVHDLNETFPFFYDTIMYKFYIVDRAGNKSNVESTGWLILNDYLVD